MLLFLSPPPPKPHFFFISSSLTIFLLLFPGSQNNPIPFLPNFSVPFCISSWWQSTALMRRRCRLSWIPAFLFQLSFCFPLATCFSPFHWKQCMPISEKKAWKLHLSFHKIPMSSVSNTPSSGHKRGLARSIEGLVGAHVVTTAVLRGSLMEEVLRERIVVVFLRHFIFKVKVQWPCISLINCAAVFPRWHFEMS